MDTNIVDVIKSSGLPQFWAKGCSDDEILAFATKYKLVLPDDYKLFLKTFGSGSIGSKEIYGLGCPPTGIPNIEFVLGFCATESRAFPEGIIPIAQGNEGYYICLVCAEQKNFSLGNMISFLPVEANEPFRARLVTESFTEYVSNSITAQSR